LNKFCAQDTKADPDYLKLEERLGINLSWEELSKGAKIAVMLRGYGSGTPGIVARVSDKLQGILQAQNLVVITRADELKELRKIKNAIKAARSVGAEHVVDALEQLSEELQDAVRGDSFSANAALQLAKEFHPDTEDFINKLLSPRAGLVSPEDFKEISNIMVRHLESRAPGMDDYIKFWKQTAVAYIQDTKSVAIPLRTFDDKPWVLRFRPEVEHEVRFWDPVSRRYIKNIYKETIENDKFLGKMSLGDARTGYGVSWTHANDAAVLRLVYKQAIREGIDIGSIHDALVANLADISLVKDYGRKAYAQARQADAIRKTLREMRSQGLSKENYERLLKLAEDSGLLRDEFSAEDILRKNPNLEFHAWGI
jgi:hypothetical protein